jgi:hypothetical protein
MRFILLLIASLVLLGCNNKVDQATIDKFESILGENNSKALSDLVLTFENEIQSKYETESVEEAYKLYLNDVINSHEMTSSKWLTHLHQRDSIFNRYQCDLSAEIWMKPDSIWIDSNWTNIAYYVTRADNFEYDTIISQHPIYTSVDNIDSLILGSKKLIEFNHFGKYIKAFKEIENANKFTKWYVQIKVAAGIMSPHITADVMLEDKADFNDYIIKRIIVIETYY